MRQDCNGSQVRVGCNEVIGEGVAIAVHPSAGGIVILTCKELQGRRGLVDSEGAGRDTPDLGTLLLNAVDDALDSRLAETAVKPALGVVFEASAESFRAVVKGVSKRFVNALEIGASHKHRQAPLVKLSIIDWKARCVLFRKLSSRRGDAWP